MVKLSDAMSRKKTPPDPPPRKPGRPKRAGGPKGLILTMRGEVHYKSWLDEFAAAENVKASDLVEDALKAWAKKRGFRTPPER